jgi:hypothetical protein
MVKPLPSQKSFNVLDNRLGVRLNFVVPTISFAEFATVLQEKGYKMEQHPNMVDSFRGEKGSREIYVDGNRYVFGVHAESVEGAITTLREIIAIADESLKQSLSDLIRFYELEVVASYYFQKEVYTAIAKLFQDSADMTKIARILGQKVSLFGFKIVPHGKNINTTDWYELLFEPKINSSGNMFHVRLLVRNEDLTKAAAHARSLEETIEQIVKIVK